MGISMVKPMSNVLNSNGTFSKERAKEEKRKRKDLKDAFPLLLTLWICFELFSA